MPYHGTLYSLPRQPPQGGPVASTNRVSLREIASPGVSARSFNVAQIAYRLEVLNTGVLERMQMHTPDYPCCFMDSGGISPTLTELSPSTVEHTATSILYNQRLGIGALVTSTFIQAFGARTWENFSRTWNWSRTVTVLVFELRWEGLQFPPWTISSLLLPPSLQRLALLTTQSPSTFGKFREDKFRVEYRFFIPEEG